jgi:DNA-binding Lrp family transcriptional regulator
LLPYREKERVVKELELKLLSELFKNNRRSDRELAKALGVAQPTVSRNLRKLEEEGVVKEHTIVPDFRKLGIGLLVFTFGVWSAEKIKNLTEEERIEKAKKFLSDHPNVVFASSGEGLGMERVMLTFHKDYAGYNEFIKEAREEWAGSVKLESFIVDLKSAVAPFPFSLINLGKFIEK